MRLNKVWTDWLRIWRNVARASVVLLVCVSVFSGCTIVEEKEKKDDGNEGRVEYFKDEGFDADKVVEDIWDSQVIPHIREKAVELTALLEAIAADRDAAGEQYGYREEGGDYPWNFIVKGEGRVAEVNTTSRKGTLSVDLLPYDGAPDAVIWIGPIIRSYSIRDALNFISFTTGVKGDSGTQYKFDTQVQFAELSNSLNRRGNQNVLTALDPEMCVKLSEWSFGKLESKLPADVMEKLGAFQGQACMPQDDLWNAIAAELGDKAEEFQKEILKRFDASDTAQGKLVRFYGALTPRKDEEITPVLFEFAEEGTE